MNKNLKIFVALGVLIAAVVGVTIITQYTDGEVKTKVPSSDESGTDAGGMPLAFRYSEIVYNPTSDVYAQRDFQGFLELNSTAHRATYLLRNTGTVPVKVMAKGRSCVACSSARLSVLSLAENQALYRDTTLAAATGSGLLPEPDVLLFRKAADDSRDWKALDFEKPDEGVVVPPAADPDTPTWCILQLIFEAKVNGPWALEAKFGLQADGAKTPVIQSFFVRYFGDSVERVTPSPVDFGKVGTETEPRTAELYYWSTTRDFTTLAPPKVGGLDGDPFLSAATPVPLTPDELAAVAAKVSRQDFAIRVRSGYKVTFTLRRYNPAPTGPRELDIGPLERAVTIGGVDGAAGKMLQLTGTVVGLVSLSDGDNGVVNVGDFRGRQGKQREFTLVGENPKLNLLPVNFDKSKKEGPGEGRNRNPMGVVVTPVGQPLEAAGVKRWRFKVTIEPERYIQPFSELLVFRVQDTGQLIRIPIKGTANAQ